MNTPIETNFRRLNLRTLNDICSNKSDLEKLYQENKPNSINFLATHKYKIRQQFPIEYNDVAKQNMSRKNSAKKMDYKIMTADEILDDISNVLNGGYYKKYLKYKTKYFNLQVQ